MVDEAVDRDVYCPHCAYNLRGLGGLTRCTRLHCLERNLGLRGEFQRYKVDAGSAGSVNIDVLSVGALWRFQ